jgi:hypothetical protein
MEESLDDVLATEARKAGVSKASLIRRCVAERYRPLPAPDKDPLTELLGISDDEPVQDVNAVVYGG